MSRGTFQINKLTSRDRKELNRLMKRNRVVENRVYEAAGEIIEKVKSGGLDSVLEYTMQFDGARLERDSFEVSSEEMQKAYREADSETVSVIREAAANIGDFHRKQVRNSWMDSKEDGSVLGQVIRPLSRVGCYVPGGTAAYPSSVLMTVIPAVVAGVEEIIVASPPSGDGTINPYTLVAADIAGASRILKMGGAQAIAALAYGSEVCEPVDKIAGPGNVYVTAAKKMVYGDVDIDMLAGPSEILVVADSTAVPAYVAADLLSQAEHDTLSSAILITDSSALAREVEKELEKQLSGLERADTARQSLASSGGIIVADTVEEAVDLANLFAPEHLELAVRDPFSLLGRVKNAGAIFMGNYTPEPVGDYWAGPNHVLPTSGTARFYSPLNVDMFMKKTSLIAYSRQALLRDGKNIVKLARAEGLQAHAESVNLRLEDEYNAEQDC